MRRTPSRRRRGPRRPSSRARRTAPRPPQSSLALQEAVQRPLTFHLNGKTVVLDVPENVRVVEDEQGKVLLIYTSDGIIRIRVTD